MQCFHYTILNNKLYLNNKPQASRLTNIPLCSFCKHENETTLHVFYSCNSPLRFWSQLKLFLEPNLIFPCLLPQTTMFDFLQEPDYQKFALLNCLLSLFKLNVYNFWRDKVLCFNKLLRDITKLKEMGKKKLFNRKLK